VRRSPATVVFVCSGWRASGALGRIRDQVRVTAMGLAQLSELLNGGRQAA